MSRLTVVIPTYNRRATLQETLEASLPYAASLDVEFIVVNDGSTDDTAAYLEALNAKTPRLTVLTKKNGGPGAARNLGASKATGDIILFMGDDTKPTSPEFFITHTRLHEQYPEPALAVLGKVIWPQRPDYKVTFVMSLIQGDGGQQFGYAHMKPYARYDWRFFYTANVSLKRACIEDWINEGFSPDFRLAAYEDGELAYRLSKKYGKFDILYAPTSIALHDHKYDVDGFIGRQYSAGWMSNVFLSKHPECSGLLGVADVRNAMRAPSGPDQQILQADMISVMEGIFASARLLEREGSLGSAAWHTPFMSAVFQLAYLRGAIWGHSDPAANRIAGYRFALDQFDSSLALAMEREHLPSVAPRTFTKKKLVQGRS